jgi:glutamyl-tRNA synthetase
MEEFEFTVEKMSNSGALFDLNKLNDVSKDVLCRIPASDLCTFMKEWSSEFYPDIYPLFEGREGYLEKILDLGRSQDKPRKDLIHARQIFEFISYFYEGYFKMEDSRPDNVSDEDERAILEEYLRTYDHNDDQSVWFDKIRSIAEALGYAAKPKDFKKNPDLYKGHVGDVSTVIRLALMGRSQSPDVWEIQQILGEEKTRDRIQSKLI